MTYKGDWQRPVQVSLEEKDLRYELAFECADNPKRKRAIMRKLKAIEKAKEDELNK